MKLLIYLLIQFASVIAFAESEVINLELGESKTIKNSFNKIWVENQKIIKINKSGTRYQIKALKPGTSHIRIDNQLIPVRVLELNTIKNMKLWTEFLEIGNKFKVSFCEYQLCLNGNLKNVNEYVELIKFLEQNSAPVIMALKVDEKISEDLQKHISENLRLNGITPQKISFSRPWKLFYSKLKPNENILRNLGIKIEFKNETTDITDNIKVSVKVVEMNTNFERKLGLHWPDGFQAQVIGNSKMAWAETFDLTLSAAEKNGEAKVLASPNLLCRSGKEAEFFAGGEFPIKIINTRTHDVTWKRYGIGLKLKPNIDSLGQMSLQIESEVSTLDRSIVIDDIPALHTNRVSSYFDLIESRTIALSGLIKNELSNSSEGLPFLKNIPILGALFSSKNFQENKSELVIFVTPELMN